MTKRWISACFAAAMISPFVASARPTWMFSKIVVKGEGIHPLYKFLTEKETDPAYAGVIQWNFTKFLVGRDGKLAARFEPKTTPSSKEVVAAIEAALGPAEPKKTEPKK